MTNGRFAISVLVFLVVTFAGAVASVAEADCYSNSCASQSEALASCNTLRASKNYSSFPAWTCTVVGTEGGGPANAYSQPPKCAYETRDYHLGDYQTGIYVFGWCFGADIPQCTAGQSSWPNQAWSDGIDCTDGCYTVPTFELNQPVVYTQTGSQCSHDPYLTSDPKVAPPVPSDVPPPETCNPDGTCKYCDATGKYCVTSTPDPPTPPAPSTSGGNGSTSTSTSTTTPASTSSTTTTSTSTTTTTGGGDGTGGTGGTGDSTGTTSGTSTSTTTTPASTSTASSNCTTGVCDVGEADGSIGGLYRSSSDTPQSVFSTYMTQVKKAPIVAAATGFFTVQASGSCPSWHIPGNEYWGVNGFDFTFFCSSAMLALFQIAGLLVLAGGAFCAFRIAVY